MSDISRNEWDIDFLVLLGKVSKKAVKKGGGRRGLEIRRISDDLGSPAIKLIGFFRILSKLSNSKP